MTAFIIFGPDHRTLKVSEDLLWRLGYGPGEGTGPEDWGGFFNEDPAAFLSGDGGAVGKPGRLKHSGGGIEQARLTVTPLDRSSGIRLVEIAFAKAVGGPVAGATGEVDPVSLNFLTTVSHELRVSLNGVIGFANLLGNSDLDENQREILSKMQSCNYLLKGLINDILEYSRAISANVELTPEPLPLGEFVREVAGLFTERARRKGLELRIDVRPSAETTVSLPKMRVTQALSNLISNAVKFTETGWVRISADADAEGVMISVQDTGPGVSDADAGRLFRPFSQIQWPRRSSEGTGLGLSIGRNLAERMGGSLYLERPAEGGCLFRLRLPVGAPAADGLPSPRSDKVATPRLSNGWRAGAASADALGREPRHVLIVEDNQLNADILSHFLRDYGATYDVVNNGRLAVETYRDGKYDLILMDVMLPELNGYEATEKILASSRRPNGVPIVGVTAKVFRRDQMRCLEAGMVEVVHKPVDFKALRQVLDRYLYGGGNGGAASEAKQPSRQGGGRGQPLNQVVLREYLERMSSGENTQQGIVDTALGIVDGEVKKLLQALRAGNREEVGQRAHSLKGALAILGAQNALDLAKGLELVASKAGEPLRTEHWSSLIEGAYEEFKSALRAYLAQASR